MAAPYWFFVSTDSGHILNRFTILIASASKWAAMMYPVLFCVLYMLQKFYLRTSRQMRFLDLEAKSPPYSNFFETLQGLVTIRDFG
ncbi:hypothetical protein ASPZODRAFT_17209 [Penicilliopsis zonata CBS 506.65]|uniref:ABC transmembrane type-1 domain-containing protein n=1 Tax=Penicilliopsis zonata CBS 506.65 TaxID=1073090 RepID=A0A1L9SF56_9EURO|nr:hypothetical protein ASPZODRAFT_17209 [Penicilliopsis zonata CBS 506.65]OJJ45768.1 hypothetical protein ASPZODRAFT_17209 [Penicilliopsis zonata CBS 506.65]